MPLIFDPIGAVTATTGLTLEFDDLDLLAKGIAKIEVGSASFDVTAIPPETRKRGAEPTVTVTLTIEMPVWAERDRRPKAEQDEWDRFLEALRAHEDGHVELYRREFQKSFKRLKKVAPDELRDETDVEVVRVKRVNKTFDKVTGHGTKQKSPHGTTVIKVP